MAFKNKTIVNPLFGQNIKFLQTAKARMENCSRRFLQTFSREPSPHYHPHQDEVFIIVKGQITVRLDHKILLLNEGDTLHIPANAIHSMWNNPANPATLNWKNSACIKR
jgi:mannose-6-phosphate isomerase-like protein (cupin superfamily)